ncbi:MAG: NADH-quinone oxidoreductase subunit C, partial [Deltaproteobacteria bacterium]
MKGKFGEAAAELQSEGFRPAFVVVSPETLPEIARFLRDDPSMKFDSLMCLSGVDYKDRFAVAYHLYS